ncbi:MAG: hypothetical protein V4621_02320 [Pseudomonadota bacterium]
MRHLVLLFLVFGVMAPHVAVAQSIPSIGGGTSVQPQSDDQKIETNWLDLWRGMSQQEAMSDQENVKASGAQTDAEAANKIADGVGRQQQKNAQDLMPTPALCGVSSTVIGLAAGEAEADVNRDAMIKEAAPKADATDMGDASRNCRYVGSLNLPGLKRACEAAGHEVLATSATQDVTQKSAGAVNIADGVEKDAEKATVAHVDLLLGAHQQFSGLGIAAKDPTRFQSVVDARSSMATDSLIKASMIRNMAARMQGSDEGSEVMKARLKSLGYDDTKIAELTGEKPSYATQLEIGTKLPYQDPNFYINLQGMNETQLRALNVGVEAQGLAQWREIYTSVIAREMMLAKILEAKLQAKQPEIAAQLSSANR